MFPANPDLTSVPELSSSEAIDPLFRIPLWMDLSLHAVPAVVLLLGMLRSPQLGYRYLCVP